MVSPSRSLSPLLQITTPRWGSRSEPRHAFQIQQYLFHGTKNEEGGFPYRQESQGLKRNELLRRLSFPRKYMPITSKIWWTMKWTPLLLIQLVFVGVRYPFWQIQNPRLPEEEGAVVKSRTGRFFYGFVTRSGCLSLLNIIMQPWGYLAICSGNSMQPSLGNRGISYHSYAYVESQDVSLGDVVSVLGPTYDDKQTPWGKRIAGLEGDRIWYTTGKYRTQYILPVRFLLFFYDSLISSVSCS